MHVEIDMKMERWKLKQIYNNIFRLPYVSWSCFSAWSQQGYATGATHVPRVLPTAVSTGIFIPRSNKFSFRFQIISQEVLQNILQS